jgi:hypothetical protein
VSIGDCATVVRGMHQEFPLEQICSHADESYQVAFARDALQILPQREDGSAEATHQGLVLRGETEGALERPIDLLKEIYGDQIRIGSRRIRYRRSSQLEEPHMGLRVLCASAHFAAVKADLLARGAVILDADATPQFGVVRATARLANLLGYSSAVAELTAGSAREVIWLSHYATVDGPPPDVA